jgi:hypothetical protein
MPATGAGRTAGADASAVDDDRVSSTATAVPTGGPAPERSIPDRPLPGPGGGVLAAGLAAVGIVAVPSFAVLLSSEMAGDPALATAALIAPPLAAISVSLILLLVRRVRRA